MSSEVSAASSCPVSLATSELINASAVASCSFEEALTKIFSFFNQSHHSDLFCALYLHLVFTEILLHSLLCSNKNLCLAK